MSVSMSVCVRDSFFLGDYLQVFVSIELGFFTILQTLKLNICQEIPQRMKHNTSTTTKNDYRFQHF